MEKLSAKTSEKLFCPACSSHNTNRFGHQNGRQRFICRTCQKTWRENPGTTAIAPERKAEILAAYQERVSLRGLSRIFGVSRNTISAWLKKSHEPAASEENACQSQQA